MKNSANPSYLFLLFLTLALCSCKSDLSTKTINDISVMRAYIRITQNPTDKTENDGFVSLFDIDDKRICNDSVTIFVNGIESKLTHKSGLYYSNESGYIFSNVPVNEIYNVEVKLSNGEKYFLGYIKSLAEEKLATINCKEKGDFNSDFVISWSNFKDIDELAVSIGTTKNSNPNEIKAGEEKASTIKNKGSFTIPKSKFKENESTVNGIQFDFRTTKNGLTNPKLLPDSKIIISTSIEKYVSFNE